MSSPTLSLTPEQARRILLRAARLDRPHFGHGLSGARACLDTLGEVQLDPIDRIGTNADLVFHARVDGLSRGDWGRLGDTFEHFAKERCLLPARRFSAWKQHAAAAPWWRLTERLKRLDAGILDAVYAEIEARGPLTTHDLTDHGSVRPLDWSGWVGTKKAGTMALEVLWTRCRIVVTGRTDRGHRIFDLPHRAFPEADSAAPVDFFETGLAHRVAVAGLLRTAGGPQWSALSPIRSTDLVEQKQASGELVLVTLEGTRRQWLCTPDALEAMDSPLDLDDRVRILGPLDPLLWDRPLVELAFGFDYLWEVYKPAEQRRWGYYVCPLIWRGQLVGRLEARRGTDDEDPVVVENVWWEDDRDRPPTRLFRAALHRLGHLQTRRQDR